MFALLYLVPIVVLGDLLPMRSALAIDAVQATYGVVQPERVNQAYFPPYDHLMFRFRVQGFRATGGNLDGDITTRLTDSRGKAVLLRSTPVKLRPLITPDSALMAFAHLPLAEALEPGEYTAEVSVTDNASGASSKFERKVLVKPVEFAVVSILFGRDPKMQIHAPAKAFSGERLFFNVNVVGFDSGQGRVDVVEKVEVLQSGNDQPLPNSIEVVVQQPVPMSGGVLTFSGNTGLLMHPGAYRLHITVTDRIAGKHITCQVPFSVAVP